MSLASRTGHAMTPVHRGPELNGLRAAFGEIDGESWMDQARCVRYVAMGGRHLWTSDDEKDIEKAIDICMDCVVFSECQAYAKSARGSVCGVYAGEFLDIIPRHKRESP